MTARLENTDLGGDRKQAKAGVTACIRNNTEPAQVGVPCQRCLGWLMEWPVGCSVSSHVKSSSSSRGRRPTQSRLSLASSRGSLGPSQTPNPQSLPQPTPNAGEWGLHLIIVSLVLHMVLVCDSISRLKGQWYCPS
jgi:hypothetical protein